MLEITIHVTGLDALAGAIARLAGAEGGNAQIPAGSAHTFTSGPAGQASQTVPTAPAAVPTAPPQAATDPNPASPQQPAPVPAAPAAPAPIAPTASVPTAAHAYTADELAKAAMTLMDAGKQMELIQLLASFGVNSIPALPPEQMGAFATALRGMGAQI